MATYTANSIYKIETWALAHQDGEEDFKWLSLVIQKGLHFKALVYISPFPKVNPSHGIGHVFLFNCPQLSRGIMTQQGTFGSNTIMKRE